MKKIIILFIFIFFCTSISAIDVEIIELHTKLVDPGLQKKINSSDQEIESQNFILEELKEENDIIIYISLLCSFICVNQKKVTYRFQKSPVS